MRRQILMASAALALISASPAKAQEVSPAEAESIQQRLTRYLPQEMIDAGLVTVKAAASVYELRLNPAVLMDKSKTVATKIEGLKPVMAYLRPMPEGTYRVEANDSFEIEGDVDAADGKNSFRYVIDSMKLDGIYDPEIFYFTSADWATKQLSYSNTSAKNGVMGGFGETAMRIATEKKSDETFDVSSTAVLKAFTHTLIGGAAGRVDIGVDAVDIDVRMDGARYKAMQDLVFFALDNMKKDGLDAARAARLKDMLRAVLPVVDNMAETIRLSNVTIGTPQGAFSADTITYDYAQSGIVDATRLSFGFNVEKPRLSTEAVPAAIKDLLPDRMALKGRADFNFAGVINYFIEHADFTKPKALTDEQLREIDKIMYPDGAMTVQYDEISAVSAIYDLHIAGKMKLYNGDEKRQSTDMTLTMRNFDKTVAYLQQNAATVPEFGQAAFGLLMMKGLARDAGGGAQAWDVTVGEDGKVLINGRPLPFQP